MPGSITKRITKDEIVGGVGESIAIRIADGGYRGVTRIKNSFLF